MTVVLAHLLAAYVVLAAPWMGCLWYQKARKRIANGVPDARIRLYRSIVGEQIITAGVVLVLWRIGRVPGASLGLIAPRSWAWSIAAVLAIVGALAWSSLRLRPKAEKVRKRLQDSVGALLPNSRQERSWWGAVSLGAGVSEELVFRGFLLYYVSTYLPQVNTWEGVLLTSLVFGLAHIYQGWQGAVSAGVLGLVFAGFYWMTGSLLLPIVIHAAVDSRMLLMLPAEASPRLAAEGKA
jgi:membrane protease YdiL (CAAX protease family)